MTSWNPLHVWFYNTCYVRVCSMDYDERNTDNLFGHLTNNSVQKHSEVTSGMLYTFVSILVMENVDSVCEKRGLMLAEVDENMLAVEELQEYLIQQYGEDVWRLSIQPQMKVCPQMSYPLPTDLCVF